jgi:hypothetical protein
MNDTSTANIYRDGVVYVNPQYGEDSMEFSLDHAISSVTHESRHQYQQAVVMNENGIVPVPNDLPAITPPTDIPSSLPTEWGDQRGYDSTATAGIYWDHPMELDARAFAGLSKAGKGGTK